ncbi:hypothetical protein BGX27_004511 [Mortierella sp. AM989]|nr:hypothetical protein BGX27_004511 [Mortierella sp. AM989]
MPDCWDTDHVRMPCSSRPSSAPASFWPEIVQGLTMPISNSKDLCKMMDNWTEIPSENQFSVTNALETFLNQKADRQLSSSTSLRSSSEAWRQAERSGSMEREMDEDWPQDEDVEMTEDFDRSNPSSDDDADIAETDFLNNEERDRFFKIILPKMQALALQLPELVKKPIPLLKQQEDSAITLSQEQIACLLANAFFNTFPSRNSAGRRQQSNSDNATSKRKLSESIGSREKGNRESGSAKHGSPEGRTLNEKPKDSYGVTSRRNKSTGNPLQSSSGQMSLFAYFGRADPKPEASGTATIAKTPQERTPKLTETERSKSNTQKDSIHMEEEAFPYYPTINFWTLFGSNRGNSCEPPNAAKLRCILHYFDRVTTKMPKGTVTFHRQVLKARVTLDDGERISKEPFCYVQVQVDGESPLEDQAPDGALQSDFANKMIGGGVLGRGAVQEEIRFAICPELIISRLFTQQLRENEALLIKGAERFSNYNGYASTFSWHSDYVDETPRDQLGRRKTEICAIDALPFKSRELRLRQFSRGNILREVNKALAGFRISPITSTEWGQCRAENPLTDSPMIATGNWGCGAFGGHVQLKFLIQLLAASVCGGYSKDDVDLPLGRDIVYYTYGLDVLSGEIQTFMSNLLACPKAVEPSLILECMFQYPIRSSRGEIVGLPKKSLFDYMGAALGFPTTSNSSYSFTSSSTFSLSTFE